MRYDINSSSKINNQIKLLTCGEIRPNAHRHPESKKTTSWCHCRSKKNIRHRTKMKVLWSTAIEEKSKALNLVYYIARHVDFSNFVYYKI